ncbi:MAG: MotA/TolQ/ExbB proton channel family protein [Aeromicrobium sp.]|jgi:biopolymer transport protein ExbB/TolQ|nr:MotA/TolQ/ExbB proton channel family protein [Aeromicrobium sp.]
METLGYYLTHPQAIIYTIASALLYPVLVIELIALAWCIFEAGRFSVELAMRIGRRSPDALREAARAARSALHAGKPDEAIGLMGAGLDHGRYGRRFTEALDRDALTRADLVKALSDTEFEAARRLERTRMLVRLGPMLGLMGTLIPISPALVGLARGDVQTLADNLVIAFSTTVIGLLIGGVAYVISAVRDRLYARDVSDIEYVLETMEV